MWTLLTEEDSKLAMFYCVVVFDLSDFVVEHPGLENFEKCYSINKYVHPVE